MGDVRLVVNSRLKNAYKQLVWPQQRVLAGIKIGRERELILFLANFPRSYNY